MSSSFCKYAYPNLDGRLLDHHDLLPCAELADANSSRASLVGVPSGVVEVYEPDAEAIKRGAAVTMEAS